MTIEYQPFRIDGGGPQRAARVHVIVGCAIALIALAYSACCLVDLGYYAADARRIGAFDPSGQMVVALTGARRDSRAELLVGALASLLLVVTVIAMITWRVASRSAVRQLGGNAVTAYARVWRSWWVLLVVAVVGSTVVQGAVLGRMPSSIVAADHRMMWFLGARTLIGLAYAGQAVFVGRTMARLLAGGTLDQPDVYELANVDYAPDGTRLT